MQELRTQVLPGPQLAVPAGVAPEQDWVVLPPAPPDPPAPPGPVSPEPPDPGGTAPPQVRSWQQSRAPLALFTHTRPLGHSSFAPQLTPPLGTSGLNPQPPGAESTAARPQRRRM